MSEMIRIYYEALPGGVTEATCQSMVELNNKAWKEAKDLCARIGGNNVFVRGAFVIGFFFAEGVTVPDSLKQQPGEPWYKVSRKTKPGKELYAELSKIRFPECWTFTAALKASEVFSSCRIFLASFEKLAGKFVVSVPFMMSDGKQLQTWTPGNDVRELKPSEYLTMQAAQALADEKAKEPKL